MPGGMIRNTEYQLCFRLAKLTNVHPRCLLETVETLASLIGHLNSCRGVSFPSMPSAYLLDKRNTQPATATDIILSQLSQR